MKALMLKNFLLGVRWAYVMKFDVQPPKKVMAEARKFWENK